MAPKFSRPQEDPRGSRLREERVGSPHDPDLQRETLRSKLVARSPDRAPSPPDPQEAVAEAGGTGAAPCAPAPEPADLPGPPLNVSEVTAAVGSAPVAAPQAMQPAPRNTRPRVEVSVDASSSEPEGPPPKRSTAQRTRTIPEDQEMQYDDESDGSLDQDPVLEEVLVIHDRPPASEASEAGSDVADLRDFGPTRATTPAAETRGTSTANAMEVDGEARHTTGGSQWRWYDGPTWRWYDHADNRMYYNSDWTRLYTGGALMWTDRNGNPCVFRWHDRAGYEHACTLEHRAGMELGSDAGTDRHAGRRHSTPSQAATEPDAAPWDAVWEAERGGPGEDWPSWEAASRGTTAPPAAAAPGTEDAPAAATGPTPADGRGGARAALRASPPGGGLPRADTPWDSEEVRAHHLRLRQQAAAARAGDRPTDGPDGADPHDDSPVRADNPWDSEEVKARNLERRQQAAAAKSQRREAPCLPVAKARAAVSRAVTSALDYHHAWSADQRKGLDKLFQCVQTLQAREQERQDNASADGSSNATSVRSQASRASTRRSGKKGAVACYGNLQHPVAQARYKEAMDALDPEEEAGVGEDAEADADARCRRSGCRWIGEPEDPAGYWVAPQRTMWCRDCGEVDDWKSMVYGYSEGLTDGERRRHTAGKARDPHYPDLRLGDQGEIKLGRCARCVCKKEGLTLPEAITKAFQSTKGKRSAVRQTARIKQFRDSFKELKNSFNALIGFATTTDNELALRRSTAPPVVPLDPQSVGAPPTSAEVADEVGRPGTQVTVAREPPPPPAGEVPGQLCVPPPPVEEGWQTVEAATLDDSLEDGYVRGHLDVDSLEALGLSKRELRRLGKCYGFVELQGLRTLMGGALGAILAKKADMIEATEASDATERWLRSLRGDDVSDDAASTAVGGPAESDDDTASMLADEVASQPAQDADAAMKKPRSEPSAQGVLDAVLHAKKNLIESDARAADAANRMRAFKAEAKGDVQIQKAFQHMADYSDQLFTEQGFTMNVYYKCQAHQTADNPEGCRGMIRADAWTQRFTLAEEAASGGTGQRWYCHCEARYHCSYGVCVELIDHAAAPPQAWYLHAEFPTEDIRDLKTLFRADKLRREGHAVVEPTDLLRHLPRVTPMALGTVFHEYAPHDPRFDGHWELAPGMTWDMLPTFEWSTLYTQVGMGINDPDWANWSKKARNKAKRGRVLQAEQMIRDYEARCLSTSGEPPGGEGARVALCALPAPAGAAPSGSASSAGPPGPPSAGPSRSAKPRALGGPGWMPGKADAPGEARLAEAAAAAEAHPVRASDLWVDPNRLPPPTSQPPPLAHAFFGPPTDSPWGQAVMALPSELLSPYAPPPATLPASRAQRPHPAPRAAAAPPSLPAFSHRGDGFVVAYDSTSYTRTCDGAPPSAPTRPRGAAAPPPPPPGPPPPTEPGAKRAALNRKLDAIYRSQFGPETQASGARRSAPPSGAASTAGDTEAEYTHVDRAFTPEAAHHATDPQPEATRPGLDEAPPPRRTHWVTAVFRSTPYNPLRQLRSDVWLRAPAPPTAGLGPPPGLLARFRFLGAPAPVPPPVGIMQGEAGAPGYAPPPIVAIDPASTGAPSSAARVAAADDWRQAEALPSAAPGGPARPSAAQVLARALPTPAEQAIARAMTQVFRGGRWQPLTAALHADQRGHPDPRGQQDGPPTGARAQADTTPPPDQPLSARLAPWAAERHTPPREQLARPNAPRRWRADVAAAWTSTAPEDVPTPQVDAWGFPRDAAAASSHGAHGAAGAGAAPRASGPVPTPGVGSATPVEEMDEATRLARARVIIESLEQDEQEEQRILDHGPEAGHAAAVPIEEMDEAARLARYREIIERLEQEEQETQRILDHGLEPGREDTMPLEAAVDLQADAGLLRRMPFGAEVDELLNDAALRRAALAGPPPRLDGTQMADLEAALAAPGIDASVRRAQLGRLVAHQRVRERRVLRARQLAALETQHARDQRLGIEAGSIDEPETPMGDTADGPGSTAPQAGDPPPHAEGSRRPTGVFSFDGQHWFEAEDPFAPDDDESNGDPEPGEQAGGNAARPAWLTDRTAARPVWLEEQHRRWAAHGSSSGGSSTPDSDAEMDEFEAIMLPPPRLLDHQVELIEQALQAPAEGGPGDAARRAAFYGFLATHRGQQAREARERGESAERVQELEEAARTAGWNRVRTEHQALLEAALRAATTAPEPPEQPPTLQPLEPEPSSLEAEDRRRATMPALQMGDWANPGPYGRPPWTNPDAMEAEDRPPTRTPPSGSDAEGDRMVTELRRRLRENNNNDQQMELLEQGMRVELMDRRQLHTEAERGEFRRRLVAHMQSRTDALRTPSPSEQSV